jgi:hypothetical protein
MKVEKAYILTIDTELSQRYLVDTIKSCEKVKLPWEEFQGFHDISTQEALEKFGFPSTIPLLGEELRGTMCMLGHMAIVKKIWERKECAVILEHDAVMLHPVTVDIPDNEIVVLGYKLKDIKRYDYKQAGLPEKLVPIEAHEGSHAYAITWKTAGMILDEFYSKGVIDNGTDDHYFLKSRTKYTKIPLTLTDPISALGWVRESTIRPSESQERNFLFIQSFVKNLDS